MHLPDQTHQWMLGRAARILQAEERARKQALLDELHGLGNRAQRRALASEARRPQTEQQRYYLGVDMAVPGTDTTVIHDSMGNLYDNKGNIIK